MRTEIAVASTDGFRRGDKIRGVHGGRRGMVDRWYVVKAVDAERRILVVRRTFWQWLLDLGIKLLDWFS